MLTYHNDPQGTGYSDEHGRGCAVGCTYDEYDHKLGPSRLLHQRDDLIAAIRSLKVAE
jgi:hypothetical protein